MRVAVLSDIHGNIDALDAVIAASTSCSVDSYICLGDCVGYYYHGAEVLDIVFEMCDHFVLGNHEQNLLDLIDGKAPEEKIIRRYGSSYKRDMHHVTNKTLDRLRRVPEAVVMSNPFGKHVKLSHTGVEKSNCYIYPDDRVGLEGMSTEGYNALYGHTHHQVSFRNSMRDFVVNPGSVGQPRQSCNGAACWALIDFEKDEIELKQTQYDHKRILQEVACYDPCFRYLREVFNR